MFLIRKNTLFFKSMVQNPKHKKVLAMFVKIFQKLNSNQKNHNYNFGSRYRKFQKKQKLKKLKLIRNLLLTGCRGHEIEIN